MRIKLVWLALVVGCSWHSTTFADCESAIDLRYEVTTEVVSGVVTIASSKHPNGTKMTYPILQLERPINVSSHSKEVSTDAPERCIKEIQLFSHDVTLRKTLFNSQSKQLSVRGSLFHGHTAWHMRSVMMEVTAITP